MSLEQQMSALAARIGREMRAGHGTCPWCRRASASHDAMACARQLARDYWRWRDGWLGGAMFWGYFVYPPVLLTVWPILCQLPWEDAWRKQWGMEE